MAFLPNPIACDVCKTVKQPSNHWWYADVRPDSAQEDDPVFILRPWDYPAEDRERSFIHLCGHACAVRALNEFMAGASAKAGQPQWTPDGPILTEEPKPE